MLGKTLIVLGVALLVTGLVITLAGRLNIGRLPGDIVIQRGGTTFHFPLLTSVIVSIVATFLLNILFRVFWK